jgi:hypothetical protein
MDGFYLFWVGFGSQILVGAVLTLQEPNQVPPSTRANGADSTRSQ